MSITSHQINKQTENKNKQTENKTKNKRKTKQKNKVKQLRSGQRPIVASEAISAALGLQLGVP